MSSPSVEDASSSLFSMSFPMDQDLGSELGAGTLADVSATQLDPRLGFSQYPNQGDGTNHMDILVMQLTEQLRQTRVSLAHQTSQVGTLLTCQKTLMDAFTILATNVGLNDTSAPDLVALASGDRRLIKEKYPKVKFWDEDRYWKWLEEPAQVQEKIQPTSLPFFEDDKGERLSAQKMKAISETARSVWQGLLEDNKAPESWAKATDEARNRLIKEVGQKHPETRLCEGSWKILEMANRRYGSWKQYKNAEFNCMYSRIELGLAREKAELLALRRAEKSAVGNGQTTSASDTSKHHREGDDDIEILAYVRPPKRQRAARKSAKAKEEEKEQAMEQHGDNDNESSADADKASSEQETDQADAGESSNVDSASNHTLPPASNPLETMASMFPAPRNPLMTTTALPPQIPTAPEGSAASGEADPASADLPTSAPMSPPRPPSTIAPETPAETDTAASASAPESVVEPSMEIATTTTTKPKEKIKPMRPTPSYTGRVLAQHCYINKNGPTELAAFNAWYSTLGADVKYDDDAKELVASSVWKAHTKLYIKKITQDRFYACARLYLEYDMYVSLEVHTEDTLQHTANALKAFISLLKEYVVLSRSCDNPSISKKTWDLPKLHMGEHILACIIAMGILHNYDTRPNEKMHGPLKEWYLFRTNFRDVASQLLQIDHHFVASGVIWARLNDYNSWKKQQLDAEIGLSVEIADSEAGLLVNEALEPGHEAPPRRGSLMERTLDPPMVLEQADGRPTMEMVRISGESAG
ncbi:hypothetical protein CONPUDRAFT_158916 [Coniophora puteana RWD-64-598 SS2]|uniref:Uncharacterized protein n=1 Tax=Coniophora puteana (strain RWD-64-598) TaxID=741705 RepID=A0A5M3M8Q2_CONPW|nr:uncharacterized protein CONPUDRAFT_158916 [Coniophora puteana RWD-64-598 SS2]EIW75453.1 hypothetical protein CONPUDRAFT_158916 [Coniophora puteana RWD-64-598 SS2]